MSKPLPPPQDSLSSGLIAKPVRTSPTSRRAARRLSLPFKQWMRLGGLTLLLAGAGIAIGISLWTSALLVLRPHPPRWLVHYWPGLMDNWGTMPAQTLAEIEAELGAQQRYAGELMDLAQISDRPELTGLNLLPVWATRSSCTQDCETIVELRLYGARPARQAPEQLQLLHQLAVQGPEESTVLKTLSQTDISSLGSTYELPLTALKSLHEDELPGAWLTLTGRWRAQGSPVLYGQMLYVNPELRRITSLLNWQSPPGRLPAWHDIDQQGLPELLVNQSYGLEPDFQLYRIDNLQATAAQTRLQAIGLTPLPLPNGDMAVAYNNALFLAQRGLWSDAGSQLAQLKERLATNWSAELEQQLQLVRLHGRFSTAQAERDWSQPSQKLLALLLDGRWQPALEQVTTKQPGLPRAVLPLLERDSARVWQRLTATLRLDPNHKAARFWSALVLMAKEDEAAALKWLSADEKSPLRKEFTTIAQTILPAAPAAATVAARPSTNQAGADASATSAAQPTWDSLIGQAIALADFDSAAWQQPITPTDLTLTPGQQWFTVTLQSGHKRQQWQRPLTLPVSASEQPVSQLWQTLGLGSSATLQSIDLVSGSLQTLEVMGLRQQGQTLQLLARGVATTRPLLVTTPGLWQDAATVGSTPLTTLLQNQPAVGDRLLSTLQNHLGFAPASLTTTLKQQASAPSPWATAQSINLVDDATPELLLTLSPALMNSQGLAATGQNPTQLILTTSGELLYSSVWSGTAPRLTGWLQPTSGNSVLVVTNGDRPDLLFWSTQNRRFQ
ncbi:MAG: hypothetical protein AAF609_03260 [Cyanobacteria bacterium P01_C01_bin.120]